MEELVKSKLGHYSDGMLKDFMDEQMERCLYKAEIVGNDEENDDGICPAPPDHYASSDSITY